MHSGVVSPEDTVAFVDGESPPEVAEHIRACAVCSAEAREHDRIQRALRQKLYRFDCPSAQTVGDYQLNMLDTEQDVQVARHVLECQECTAELHSLRAYLASDPQLTTTTMDRVRRVVARLFTPTPGLAPAGVRGVSHGHTLTYEAGDVAITVQPNAASSAGQASVIGMVLPMGADIAAFTGAEARLSAPDGTLHRRALDDFGSFTFDGIPIGVYTLEVELLDQVALIEGLLVGGSETRTRMASGPADY